MPRLGLGPEGLVHIPDNISKIVLKTSTVHIKHTTTTIFAHLSKGTKVILQVDYLV